MSKLAATLREEITRLGRKEANRATIRLKARVAALEKLGRAQRKAMEALGRQLQAVQSRAERAPSQVSTPAAADGARLSPGLIRSLRKRLKVSQTDFARLTGVTHVAVYLWESGRTKPQAAKRQAILALRGLGMREVRRRLEKLDAAKPARGKRRRKKTTTRRAPKALTSKAADSMRRGRRRS
jgi:DNA-binding transcriptional regulator YiaG